MRTTVRRSLIALAVAAGAGTIWLWLQGGRFLQHEDPLERADAIFVLAGSRLERPLEAVDLFQAGYAPLIALSPGQPEAAEVLARQRGAYFPRETEPVRAALIQLGVPPAAIVTRDDAVDNTAQEGTLLRALAAARGWRRVIVVTSKYHTRRTGFAMRRALAGTGVAVIVRASRYDVSDPARWWRRRADIRYVPSEWEKLVAYRFGAAD